MSDHPVSTPAAPGGKGAAEQPPYFPITGSWKVASIGAIVMVLLALLGVGLTASGSTAAAPYWVALVPVYGAVCVATAWARAHKGEKHQIVRQALHWVGVAVALGLDFVVRSSGEETSMAAGMNALLLLALGCYLAGVHLDWLFVPVGILLTLALICVAKADQYLWLIFVVGGLAIAGLLFVMRRLSRAHARAAAAHSVPAGS
jgi:hypothetical protein